jgi:hypothetical protein
MLQLDEASRHMLRKPLALKLSTHVYAIDIILGLWSVLSMEFVGLCEKIATASKSKYCRKWTSSYGTWFWYQSDDVWACQALPLPSPRILRRMG